MKQQRCILFGATGKLGSSLARSLVQKGYSVVAIGRNLDKIKDLFCQKICLDFKQPNVILPFKLTKEDIIINVAHARYTEDILELCKPVYKKFILIGSTRKYSQLKVPADEAVRKAEKYIRSTNRPYLVLHPTMIYGADGENNVQRIAKIASLFPFIPLPRGLKANIQPIHVDDLVASIIQAVKNEDIKNTVINVAGFNAMTYNTFLKEIFKAAGIKAHIFSIPLSFVYILAFLLRFIPKTPSIKFVEIKRLFEDKSIDISSMEKKLGIKPRTFSAGLRQTFDK